MKTKLQTKIYTFGGTKTIASLLEVAPNAVYSWVRQGQFPIPRAMQLETLTNGAIPRQLTRPKDWQAIWPDLAPASTPTKDAP